jgi:hypothetical protein
MDGRKTDARLSISGRIDRKTHDVSSLKNEYPNWDSFSKEEKLAATRNADPIETDTVYNVTTDELHQYFVRNLDVTDTSDSANVSASYLGLGTDAASGTATTDTDLNNRVYAEPVTDAVSNGKDLLVSTFLDSTEGNGNDFDELGLFSGDPVNLANDDVFLVNHATFSPVTKDNTRTVTFDVTLTFSDV